MVSFLWLFRHGHALPQRTGEGDADRELSDFGRRQVERQTAVVDGNAAHFELWHSPFVRACQTADVLDSGRKRQTLDALTPHGSVRGVCDQLDSSNAEGVVVVSHLPLLPALAAELLHNGAFLSFSTADAAFLERDGAKFQLKSFHPAPTS